MRLKFIFLSGEHGGPMNIQPGNSLLQQNGGHMMIDIHTHKPSGEKGILEIVNLMPGIGEKPLEGLRYSVGWHPWHAQEKNAGEIEKILIDALKWPGVVALGECGLDRACPVPLNVQKKVFQIHLDLSAQSNLPLIVHSVRASSDVLEMLKSSLFKGKIIFHAFHGSKETTQQLMKYNAWFSFGHRLLNEHPKITGLLPLIPTDRIFLETDDSGVPIALMYKRAAKILQMEIPQLLDRVAHNFAHVFNTGPATTSNMSPGL